MLCQHCVELLPARLHHGEALLDRDVKRRVSAHRFASQGCNCLAAAKVISKLVEALINNDRGVDIKADGIGHAQRRLRALDAQARHMPQRRVLSPSCYAGAESKAAHQGTHWRSRASSEMTTLDDRDEKTTAVLHSEY